MSCKKFLPLSLKEQPQLIWHSAQNLLKTMEMKDTAAVAAPSTSIYLKWQLFVPYFLSHNFNIQRRGINYSAYWKRFIYENWPHFVRPIKLSTLRFFRFFSPSTKHQHLGKVGIYVNLMSSKDKKSSFFFNIDQAFGYVYTQLDLKAWKFVEIRGNSAP